MKPEDFEQQFAKHDPAASLSPMSESDFASTVAHATSTDAPRLRGPVSNRSKWFVGVAAATAAVVALNAPAAMVASVPVLRLSGGANSSKMGLSDSMVAGGMETSRLMWSSYRYTIEGMLSSVTPSEGHTAYKLVPLDGIEDVAQRIITYFGVEGVVESTDQTITASKVWATNGEAGPYLYIYSGTGASWSYFNSKYDNFVCKDVTASADDATNCGPRTIKNVLSTEQAETKAKNILSNLGLLAGEWTWVSNVDDRGVTVTGTRMAQSMKSPISVAFTFADNGEISGAWGSLETFVALGDYNIISEVDAVARANKMTDEWLKMANQGPAVATDVPAAETDSTQSSGASTSASEPSPIATSSSSTGDDAVAVDPGLTTGPSIVAQEASVTAVNFTMMDVWDTDGNHLWLPAYELVGHVEGSSEEWPLTTVVAVIDSQIDLSQFFGVGGVMPMMR